VKRRTVIVGLGSAVLCWTPAAPAQQRERMRRIALLVGATEEHDPEAQARIAGFRQGLEALGWSEGRNILIDYRFAGGDADRIHTYVMELVNSAPDVIVANGSPVAAALKRATSTIPIVLAVVSDPVGQGFIASLAHPGGNITGFTLLEFEIVGKWVELLNEIAPNTRRTMLLFNPVTAPYYSGVVSKLQSASTKLATELSAAPVQDQAEIEPAIAAFAREPGGGLISGSDVFTVANRQLILSLAARYRLPAIYQFRQFALDGGLMSYGPDTADIFRRSAAYVDRILKGEKPADLPVQQPTKFEFVINLKAANALGLTIPPSILARADEVIE
jgi:putative tryptophan/tyrosine transport system substrate-binding protein